MQKALLLGMNNPLSDDPKYDLYPYPEGSTGWRLWQMLPTGASRAQYMNAFQRRNLLRARAWDPRAARAAAASLLPELRGRFVIVLGTPVRAALGFKAAEPLSLNETDGIRWVAFPHPSGRNRWFNDPTNHEKARMLLTTVAYASLAGQVGRAWDEIARPVEGRK